MIGEGEALVASRGKGAGGEFVGTVLRAGGTRSRGWGTGSAGLRPAERSLEARLFVRFVVGQACAALGSGRRGGVGCRGPFGRSQAGARANAHT